jgi:methyl-accepting chemotaxis protein
VAWKILNQLAKRIEAKDLSPLPPLGVDERLAASLTKGQFGAMLATLRSVHAGWRELVAQARESARAITTGASEIAAGNSNLSQRTEQQASTLEETASGMEELAGTVEQNADNCKLASGLAQNAETVAKQGAHAVHGVVEGMGKIDQSSKRMADIIGVIEGIAFQTNILALNAAVEAARAGEQGRGFAVVASEVRALAQRSADAAKEIKALIEQSVSQINDGSKQAEGAGKVIDEIVVSVQQVNQLIGEIAVASSEQSAGVGEINKAVLQLETMTQQNAALVEEAAASSLTFQEQADRLRDIVARFKFEDEAAPVPKRPGVPMQAAPRSKPDSLPRAAPRPLPRKQAARRAVGADDEWKEF